MQPVLTASSSSGSSSESPPSCVCLEYFHREAFERHESDGLRWHLSVQWSGDSIPLRWLSSSLHLAFHSVCFFFFLHCLVITKSSWLQFNLPCYCVKTIADAIRYRQVFHHSPSPLFSKANQPLDGGFDLTAEMLDLVMLQSVSDMHIKDAVSKCKRTV